MVYVNWMPTPNDVILNYKIVHNPVQMDYLKDSNLEWSHAHGHWTLNGQLLGHPFKCGPFPARHSGFELQAIKSHHPFSNVIDFINQYNGDDQTSV